MISRQLPHLDIVVRFARCEGYGGILDESRLGVRERRTLSRNRAPDAHRDYVAGHVLARAVVGEMVGRDPATIQIRHSPLGRPVVVAPPDAAAVTVSISHADGIALCAATFGQAVGADVESLRNVGPDPLAVAKVVCSARELELLTSVPPRARAERFLRTWALKEAVAKAVGLGFRMTPQQIIVALPERGPPRIRLIGGETGAWRVALFRPTPWHVVALAARRRPGEPIAVRLREVRSREADGDRASRSDIRGVS